MDPLREGCEDTRIVHSDAIEFVTRPLGWLATVAFMVLVAVGCGSDTAPPSQELVAIGVGLRGPAGFRASIYARGLPQVAALTSDPDGRLWAATAAFDDSGIGAVYLIDSGSAPRKVITGVHTPLGLLWRNGSLHVSSHARVEVYGGFDGTSFATRRTIVSLPTGVGENNGLALSPDGRIVVGISAPCDACTPTSPWSAAVVSFLPDGSGLRVEASAIRAPGGLAYFPGTGDLFVTMNQRDDLGARTPGDWLAEVRPGQAWGFPQCYGQGGRACAGVPRPVAALDTHAAVSGLAMVNGALGSGAGTSAVIAEWAKGKVQRVELDKTGTTYTGHVQPFLTGLRSPVPVLVTTHSELLVGDWATGIIYRVTGR